MDLSRKILDPMGVYTDCKTGELLPISSTDADETSYVLDDVPRVTGAVVATISCGGVLLGIDVPLGLMVLIGVPAVLAGLQLTAPMIAKPVEEQQAEIGRATALATDLISGHDRFRASEPRKRRRALPDRQSPIAGRHPGAARIQSIHAGAAAPAGAFAGMAVAMAAVYFALHDALPQ